MEWTTLFTKTEDISAARVKEYLNTLPQTSVQLVDVRQAKEYQKQHIPGAVLIPIGELKDRIGELTPDLPIIVYCRSGVRSKAGCQILRESNFTDVLNMTGGILQWNGATAFGGEEFGVDFFLQGKFTHGYEIAYHLEKGLQQFYRILAKDAQSCQIEQLLTQMAQMEDGHMALLMAQSNQAGLEINIANNNSVVEGGLSLTRLQTAFGDNLNSAEAVIQLAMMFEAQAWDLYSRLSRKSTHAEEKNFYQQMAEEEQKHLDKLSAELDNLL